MFQYLLGGPSLVLGVLSWKLQAVVSEIKLTARVLAGQGQQTSVRCRGCRGECSSMFLRCSCSIPHGIYTSGIGSLALPVIRSITEENTLLQSNHWTSNHKQSLHFVQFQRVQYLASNFIIMFIHSCPWWKVCNWFTLRKVTVDISPVVQQFLGIRCPHFVCTGECLPVRIEINETKATRCFGWKMKQKLPGGVALRQWFHYSVSIFYATMRPPTHGLLAVHTARCHCNLSTENPTIAFHMD